MALTDICRVFHPAAALHKFFSAAHGTFNKINSMLGHKSSLRKYKKVEITSSVLSDQCGVKNLTAKETTEILNHLETE
jgi:hypothetical protein